RNVTSLEICPCLPGFPLLPEDSSQKKMACDADPNFAVVFSFLERFGTYLLYPDPTLQKLEDFLNDPNGNFAYFCIAMSKRELWS
ncbi:MAG: hypothetical protein ABW185_27825, partial [Sedimenticola sp.]